MSTVVQITAPREPLPPNLRPELLAPAGDRDCVRAAVENGADAVYFGLDSGFNARARAANFSAAELPDVLRFLHGRGVKGYVTLNTLIFSSELSPVEELVRRIAMAGVDAVLVQDLGLVRLIRAVCPDLPIHASTQMTLTSAECIRFVESLGVERVVLARELSVKEVGKIHSRTAMQLEVFVHGALCVAYSGQCLTSESLGGRSANRGQCAQACRLPYDLICDGRDVDTADAKYLLSPQDLAAYELVPDLIAAGVCSLKIEGRLKTPEYVANITRYYREAIDSAMAGRPVAFTPRQVEEMELSFSRGFSPGWLRGCDHKMLVPGKSSSKRGVHLGAVEAVRRGRVLVRLAGRLKRGDGVVFDCGRPVDDEQGGRVYEIFSRDGRPLVGEVTGGLVELAFGHGALDLNEVQPGQQIWKTDDPELTNRLRKSFTGPVPLRRLPIDIHVEATVGQPLRVCGRIGSDADTVDVSFRETTAHAEREVYGADASTRSMSPYLFELATPDPLAPATKHALTVDTLRGQFGRLGGTAYELRNLTACIVGRPMVPFSILGKLRHELVQCLDQSLATPPLRRVATVSVLPRMHAEICRVGRGTSPASNDGDDAGGSRSSTHPTLHVLCRSLPQLRDVLDCDIRYIYADFQDIRQYRLAVQLVRAAGAEIFLATPRIQKPDEVGIFHALAKYGADGILVRNLGGLLFYRERQMRAVADFSLNVANELTARLLREHGVERLTASYDLNREQLLELVAAVPAEWLEVVVHQHMPMFHMEHCVFCAVLSPGTNKTNCGRPCDRHTVQLRDRIGMEHRLTADVGCRNTLFNAVPQSAAEVVPTLLAHGVCHFRVELLDAPAEQTRQVLDLYRALLANQTTGREVWTRLNATNRVGVTRGTLEERRNPLAIL